MTGLVTDLLYLSQLDARSVSLQSEPVDIAQMARAATASPPSVAIQRHVSVQVEAPDLAQATADSSAVRQVLGKLLDNACRYGNEGSVATIGVAAGAGLVTLWVASEGVPAGGVERIFERFYRADPARGDGTGLGLSIARELVTLMSGSILAEARDGSTVITVNLPASPLPGPALGPAPQ